MKKWFGLFLLTFVYFNAPAFAQSGLFGSCDQEKVIKFIDVGLSKDEIVQLCHPGNKTAAAKKSPKSAQAGRAAQVKIVAKASSTSKGNLSVLDGKWDMDAICDPYSAYARNVTLKNGKFIGILDGGDDTLNMVGTVEKDGSISGYGNGTYVFGEFEGKITDWQNGKAKGTISIGGEMDCEGSWKFTRMK